MGSNTLEQQLGELSGQLKGLIPALERVEERMREVENHVATSDARYEGIRREYDELKRKVSDFIGDLYKQVNSFNLDSQYRKSEIESLRRDLQIQVEKELSIVRSELIEIKITLQEEKKKSAGMTKKLWELFKLLLAGSAGAGASWFHK